MTPKLQLKSSASILGVATVTIPRIANKDKTFPPLEKVGRSVFINNDDFYKWLSEKAGKEVTSKDNLLKGSDLKAYYSKSHTWLWQQVKAGNLQRPFKINRTNYWLERDIFGEGDVA